MVRGLIFKLAILFSILFSAQFYANHPSQAVRDAVAPYLMPDDHPIKPGLDALFEATRVILNLDTLKQAGFDKSKPRKFTKLIVTRHPSFPGYIFKIYLDAQRFHKDKPEYYFWLLRTKGASKIEAYINNHGLQAFFKVPNQWIYELPEYPQPHEGYYQKYYILIEEDMDLLPESENEELWASDQVTHFLLDNVYLILKTFGLRDCAKPDNIPFSTDGRISFIDTQTYYAQVPFKRLTPFLSEDNQRYWRILIDQ